MFNDEYYNAVAKLTAAETKMEEHAEVVRAAAANLYRIMDQATTCPAGGDPADSMEAKLPSIMDGAVRRPLTIVDGGK